MYINTSCDNSYDRVLTITISYIHWDIPLTFSSSWKGVIPYVVFGPPALPEGPTNSALFVRPSVQDCLITFFCFFFSYIKWVFIEHIKVRKLLLWGKFLMYIKWGNWGIFGYFSVYLFIRFFWNWIWWQALTIE